MSLEIHPLTVEAAKIYLREKECQWSNECDFAIAVSDGKDWHGVIAMKADGNICSLAHLYTDGTALVGSLLYGAAWRAAKALGYKTVTL